MIQIDLSNAILFKNLIELEANDIYVDLHNDYMCERVRYAKNTKIKIDFIGITKGLKYNKIGLSFEGVEVVKMSLPFQEDFIKEITIDNFYRERFEIDNELHEFSKTGKAYYYIEFYEDYSMEFFAEIAKADLFLT